MSKRRFVILLGGLALLWGTVLPQVVAAADETKQGNTTGSAVAVVNLYMWQGDVTRYGQGEAQYQITIQAGTQVYARWECQTRNGPLINFTSGTVERTVNVTAAAFSQASMIFAQGDGRCAYHAWKNSGVAGFKVLTASFLFWLSEFNGGGGNNGGGGVVTPPPSGSSASPGASGINAGATPTPTPAPSGPPPLTCVITKTNGDGAQYTTMGADPSCRNYPGDTFTYVGTNNAGSYHQCDLKPGAGSLYYRGSPAVSWTSTSGGDTIAGTYNAADVGELFRVFMWADPPFPHTCTFTVTFQANGHHVVPPTPSPPPSASPSGGPGACASGTVWTGTNCAFPPGASWFPGGGGGALPPPLVQPSTGPFLGGSGGIQEPAPNTPNNNGLGECTADDGTYSKPGQAALQALPNTSFPGSINPLDYIPWVGNLVATVPVTVQNAAQWSVNTGIDLVVPGECVATLITDASDAMMAKAPLSLYVEARDAFEGALGSAGSGSVPSATIAGVTLTLPLSDIAADVAPWRGWAGAFVWLMGIIAVVRLIGGTLGVSNGGGGE